MNISKSIKEQRNRLSLSQEELAEKLYVSRQTIGNWENDRSYPDIHSLILLSQIFDMTIDQLVKGDLEMMLQTIEKDDIRAYSKYRNIYTAGSLLAIIIFSFAWYQVAWHHVSLLGPRFLIPLFISVILFAVAIKAGAKAERLKKQYDVHTYREIVAFTKGETLDEIAKIRESGKRSYQYVINALIWTALGLLIGGLFMWVGITFGI